MIDYRISKGANVARDVRPGAFTVIREHATIGEGVQIGPGVYIAPYIIVGTHADIGPHAVILANVPAGAVVGAAVVWDETSMQAADDVLEAPAVARGRPRKAVR